MKAKNNKNNENNEKESDIEFEFLDKKGFKKSKIKNQKIFNRNISCEYYDFGKNNIEKDFKVDSDSIIGYGSYIDNRAMLMLPEKIFSEILEFGEDLYNICKKNINIDKEKDNLDISKPILDLISNHKNEVLDIILKFVKRYGFPIKMEKPIVVNSELFISYNELKFNQIQIIAMQLMLIFLLNEIYETLNYFNSFNNLEDFKLDNFDEYTDINGNSIEKKHIENIIKYSKLLDLKIDIQIFFYNFEKYKKNILKKIVTIFNEFEKFFDYSLEKYYSFSNGRLNYYNLYNNLLDIFWEYLLSKYVKLSNNIDKKQKECDMCHKKYIATSNHQYLCKDCAKERKKNKNYITQNNRINKIKEILDYAKGYDLDKIPKFYKKLCFYESIIYEDGHTKELHHINNHELDEFFRNLISFVKNR